MKVVLTNVHPDDVLTLHEVAGAMNRVCQKYALNPRSVGSLPDEYLGEKSDRIGDCNGLGEIRIAFRYKDRSGWALSPCSKDEIYETAAHELAHLKHMNHGDDFLEFEQELYEAMNNQKEDHRTKIIGKIVKMQAQRDGEAAIGNEAAAQTFATMINKMLIDYELNPTEIDYAKTMDRDPVIERWVDLETNGIKSKKVRCAWQERLASIVASAHMCTIFIRPGSNGTWFVGTEAHALVAEYTYVTLVRAAEKLSEKAWVQYWREGGGKIKDKGFRPGWLDGFVYRIGDRFAEARKQALAEYEAKRAENLVPTPVGGESTALIRLNGQLRKVSDYVDNKFRGKSTRSAGALRGSSSYNNEGRTRGRAAADALALGRKGLTGSTGPRGLLK